MGGLEYYTEVLSHPIVYFQNFCQRSPWEYGLHFFHIVVILGWISPFIGYPVIKKWVEEKILGDEMEFVRVGVSLALAFFGNITFFVYWLDINI